MLGTTKVAEIALYGICPSSMTLGSSLKMQTKFASGHRACQTWEAAVPAAWSIPDFACPWAESMPDLAAC